MDSLLAEPWFLPAAFAALTAGVVGLLRLARGRGWMPTKLARCERCRERRPVVYVEYHQNTGMLVMRRSASVKAQLCRGCSVRTFARLQLHTLFLGWWGFISALVTPLFLVTNFAYLLATLTLPGAQAHARSALEEHRDYARNLIATKDEATVVEVLARQTGASPQDVQRFVRDVQRGSAASP